MFYFPSRDEAQIAYTREATMETTQGAYTVKISRCNHGDVAVHAYTNDELAADQHVASGRGLLALAIADCGSTRPTWTGAVLHGFNDPDWAARLTAAVQALARMDQALTDQPGMDARRMHTAVRNAHKHLSRAAANLPEED